MRRTAAASSVVLSSALPQDAYRRARHDAGKRVAERNSTVEVHVVRGNCNGNDVDTVEQRLFCLLPQRTGLLSRQRDGLGTASEYLLLSTKAKLVPPGGTGPEK